MKKKRFLKCLLLLFIFASLALIFMGYLLSLFFSPKNYGITPEHFLDEQRVTHMLKTIPSLESEYPEKPNIIIILADDLGYGDLSCQGSQAIQTPYIDQLASEGMRFTHAYASAPVCSPSRAGLLTGRYPLRSGIMMALPAANDTLIRTATRKAGMAMAKMGTVDMIGGENAVKGLPLNELTLPEALKSTGYRTAAFGKWHLGDFTEQPSFHPVNHGFDHFVGFNMSNDDWPVAFWRDQEEIVEDIGIDQEKYTGLFTEAAIDFMAQSTEVPFFIYLSHKDPHQPFYPSDAYAGKSEGGPYGDAVSEFDGSVGSMIAALTRLSLDKNTLVIVTSDNGPWFEGDPGGLRGRKGQSYEGGFRVPMIVWWPGQLDPGSILEEAVMHIDLFPTLLHLAGLGLPSDRVIDGVDLLPRFTGQPNTLAERPLYFFHDYDVEAIRIGPWKYLRSNSHYTWPVPLDKKDNVAGQLAEGTQYIPSDGSDPVPALGYWPSLYHLGRDPAEAYNVAKKYPEICDTMAAQLEVWQEAFYKNPRGWK